MITPKQISKGIIDKVIAGIQSTAYKDVKFSSTDIKEGFKRPSFFLDLDDSKKGRATNMRVERTLTAKIYYFPTDKTRPKLENLDVQDILENLFLEPLFVDGSAIDIEETDSVVSDGVLQFSFDVSTIEEYSSPADAALEPMETIEIEMKG